MYIPAPSPHNPEYLLPDVANAHNIVSQALDIILVENYAFYFMQKYIVAFEIEDFQFETFRNFQKFSQSENFGKSLKIAENS